MGKKLSEMSLEELWELFPIYLTEHQDCWSEWYEEEQNVLKNILPMRLGLQIYHIGSTAIHGIWAKPIVDILIELPDAAALVMAKELLVKNGYICMSESDQRISLNKGYTENGFAERVFHIHLRLLNDKDEIYFRDYLNEHTEIAEAYEDLKINLWKRYEHDRDQYTAEKTEFVNKYTSLAKQSLRVQSFIETNFRGQEEKTLNQIENYVHEMRYKNIDNILITKNGQDVYSKNFNKMYDGKKHRIASIIKSIISLGTGIAVDRGYVRLDDYICKYLGESFHHMTSKAHRKITIRDLLTLSSGIYWQFGIHASQPLWSVVEAEEDWSRAILELPSAYTPGKKFYYKDADVYLLTQVLQKATGQSIENFIYENLYRPLGIVCAAVDHDLGISSDNMTNIGMLTAQEMARIGNLCLNRGEYQGQRIVSEAYLKLATAKQIDADAFSKYFGMKEYGFLWWIHEDAYFARGFGGNEIAVFPKYGLVVVIQATAKKVSKEYLDVIYNVILKDESLISQDKGEQ